jgi:hypothetical protein
MPAYDCHFLTATKVSGPGAMAGNRLGFGVAALALVVALSGCGMGALPSSHSGPVTGALATPGVAAASTGIDEIHSTTCPGLAIERQERLRRIAALQTAIAAELKNLPTTVAQAVQRASGAPEEGTLAYGEMMVERAQLDSIAAAGTRLRCPPMAVSAEVLKSP